MEASNNFSKGLHTDSHELFQPGDTYRFAQNYNREMSGALTNESGSLNISTMINGLNVIGATVLGTKIIYFLCSNDNTQNEIGVLDTATNTYVTTINSPVLNFSIDKQVDAVARINFQHQSMVYFVDDKNPPRKVNLDNPPTPAEYVEVTKLIRDVKLPMIENLQFTSGGSLKDGTYQFSVRYVDANGNKTPFGFWSKPVPVIDESRSGGRNNYDGGDLTTTAAKTIVLDINNLDPLFPYIEVAVFYLNASAQETYKIIDKYAINSSSFTLVFGAIPTTEDLDLNAQDATIEFPNIGTAKCIEQKDKRCFISNISEIPEADLQIVANNIEVEYVIKEVDYFDDNGATADHFEDYKDENMTFEFKGYQRDEVYSLGFGVAYKSGQESFVYHIPGRLGVGNNNITGSGGTSGLGDLRDPLTQNRVWVAPTVDTATTGKCGTYVSTDAYPVNQNYPTDGVFKPGTPNLYLIRHHKMPSLEQQNHFLSGGTKIRVLGLKFILNPTARAILDTYSDVIQAIAFHREPRTTRPENQSIFGQGLVKNLFKTYDDYIAGDGSPAPGYDVYKKEPWFGNYHMTMSTPGVPFAGARRAAAFYPVSYNASATATQIFDSAVADSLKERNKLAFFSPEVYLDIYKLATFTPSTLGVDKMNLYANTIKTVLKVSGTVGTVELDGSTYHDGTFDGVGNINLEKAFRLWVSANYSTVVPMVTSDRQRFRIDTNKSQLISGGTSQDILEGVIQVDNTTSSDFLYLKLTDKINSDGDSLGTDAYTKPSSGKVAVNFDINVSPSFSVLSSGSSSSNDTYSVPGTDTQLLCNLTNERINQYGQIGNKFFNIIELILDTTQTEYECYGGDTFIAKYAYTDKDVYRYKGLHINYLAGVPTTNWEPPTDKYGADPIDQGGFSAKSLSWYFAETVVNPNYQHGLYFPRQSASADLDTRPYTTSNNQSYNKTYSSDKEIKPGISKSADFALVSNFETRTYYSAQSVEGEILDAFTEFRVNDYDDLPKHTGPINDSFVWENEFYLHTPQSLWQTFVNPRSAMVDTYSDVLVGNGGIFAVPSKQLFTIDGGYCGTTSHFGGCNTPFGRFFIDNRQGKAFLFNSQGIEEISAHGMFKDFLTLVTDIPDTPGAGSGYMSAYDYKKRRWLLTKVGAFTISYHPELKSWTSYHTYLPNHIISVGNRVVMFKAGVYQAHELGIGNKGVYFGAASADSVIRYITNIGPGVQLDDTKCYDNKEFHTISHNQAGVTQLFDTFDRMQCRNEYQDTGEYEIITDNTNYIDETLTSTQIMARMKNNHFQTIIPREAGSPDEARMKSQWLDTTLKYSNALNNNFIVSFVKTKLRKVFR